MYYVNSFAEIEQEFIERISTMVWCNAATVDRRQRPRSRVVHPLWEGLVGWFTSEPRSAKVKQLAANPFISLAYIADPMKPVYVECRATWHDDLAAKQHMWDMFKRTPEPLGGDLTPTWGSVENPGWGVLRLTPWRIELYDLLNQSNRKVWDAERQR